MPNKKINAISTCIECGKKILTVPSVIFNLNNKIDIFITCNKCYYTFHFEAIMSGFEFIRKICYKEPKLKPRYIGELSGK